MNDWNLYVQNSGLTYDYETTIPRPNDNLTTKRVATSAKIRLADGSNAFVFPETKYVHETMAFFWAMTTQAFRELIEGHITDGDTVKIVTHTSEEFVGFFGDMSRIWLIGMDDTYDIQVTFERIS